MTVLDRPLAQCRVLLSNDDGIHAPGLAMLEKVVRGLAREVWVVAPETEQSAASHSLTLRRPLRIRHLEGRRYAVDGTPTDSILMAVKQVMKDQLPDLVISGVNRGGNLGEDVTYSGTIAAAMEGTLLGIPSIATSQVTDDRTRTPWSVAEHWLPEVLTRLVAMPWPPGVLMNVNFPDTAAAKVTGIEACRQGRRKLGGELVQGIDPRGQPYYWFGGYRHEKSFPKGTDLEAIRQGAISVTPLSVGMTHRGGLRTLREALS
ncbi:MAG: 5'/3'-nucleotidase SurE [Hyphomicrobiales bacterium]|nr:5'/3'-nucleotidase SurE [Hyphomicrobiales bacterium]MCP5372709.1 5'/3'-nucleotidase SurE [Hyphomicrobiales bacterium]